MPDPLTHYLASYLISSRIAKPKYSLLIALAGLLPDIDVVFRIHRWVTHSLVLVALIATPVITLVYWYKRRYLGLASIILLTYTLHLLLDIFTGPTPILYPLADSLWVKIQVNGVSTTTGISITPSITMTTVKPDFTQRKIVEGPLVTESGAILAVVTAVILLLECFFRAKKTNNWEGL
jgi:membrane-bound metal-dependent hydrolase YbcI (DUF457 family)